MSKEQSVLEEFLNLPIKKSRSVADIFSKLSGAVSVHEGHGRNFVYVPGTRDDRVLLVAHCDTYWDSEYGYKFASQKVVFDSGVYKGEKEKYGIGADDRAGCAMLYLLKDSGHSLLLTDGEEHGQISVHFIQEKYPELFDELNSHCYAIQLDRRNADDYKCYGIPVTEEFREFIENSTGYKDAGTKARTDIVALCRDICGVNLSVGYYNEHHPEEYLCYGEWLNTYNIVKKLLEGKQKKYPVHSGGFI